MFKNLEVTYAYEAKLHPISAYGPNVSVATKNLKEKVNHTALESHIKDIEPVRIDDITGLDREFLYISSTELPDRSCTFYAAMFILYPVFQLVSPDELEYNCIDHGFLKDAAKALREKSGKYGRVMVKQYLKDDVSIDVSDEMADSLAIRCQVHANYVNDLVSRR